LELYLLSGGLLDAYRSVIHPTDDSHRRVVLPCMQVLIRSEGRTLLIDTGMPPVAVGDPEGLSREYGIETSWIRASVEPHERLTNQLETLGLDPSDLDLIINTHLHFDHAGGNAFFPAITIAVQEDELVAAREEDYLPIWDAPGLTFRSVRGDWDPAPGVEMFLTPGHTPGHQSMLVRTSERPWLFTFDAVYTEEHWRTKKLGAVQDVASARPSMERLRHIAAREDARIVFGHDIAQWEALGMLEKRMPRLVASR
ncbi:MAG: N-acyl homoserine lactonase family protein, partial [Chloroflexota bacterium]